MSLLDKLHDKALTAKKKHVKYPLLIASGITDWFAGTADEIEGHCETAEASEEERDYKLYGDGVKGAAIGEVGAYAATVYTRNKIGLVLAADLLVRELNAIISLRKSLKQIREEPDDCISCGPIEVDLTGAIGTARRIAYKIGDRFGRSDVEADEEPVDYEDMEDIPPDFPDPLPDPLEEDGMRITDPPEKEPPYNVMPVEPGREIIEEEELFPFEFDTEPEPSDPEPVQLPGPDEDYELPDIVEPEEEPDADLAADELLDDAPETPSSKPAVDIGPLDSSYIPQEAEPEDDDEDPLGFIEGEDSENEFF